jgi:hypothetical protein
MTVTDAQVTALRAVLTGDGETFDRVGGESGQDYGEEIGILTATAFATAARYQFPSQWSMPDLIRFVGRVRARDQGEYADISASAAEQMLRAALSDEPMHGEFDEVAYAYAQAVLLAELVSDLDAQQLDAFLAEARVQADRHLAAHARR